MHPIQFVVKNLLVVPQTVDMVLKPVPSSCPATEASQITSASKPTKNDPGFVAAVKQAKLSLSEGGIPIGACLVAADGHIIGEGRNMRVQKGSATLHVCNFSDSIHIYFVMALCQRIPQTERIDTGIFIRCPKLSSPPPCSKKHTDAS